ncbi:alpha/beta hydrolase [Fontibacillus sp. BL9]|uniref:alpha/beta hydrolase n=1 Tax=Fontibacillus sp. BL9 TaxID=3389971 RepID=UPI0039797D24
MKCFKVMLCAVLLFLVGGPQMGLAKVQKDRTSSASMSVNFYSESLQKEMHMSVYLPPHYNAQDEYPVLYVLHSYTVNESQWFNTLKITETADALISSGKIEPMIIVAPRINNSFGVNSSDVSGYSAASGKPEDAGVLHTGKYEDYISKDVVEFVDTHFNTIKSRQARYLGGTSMGGFAALHIGFKHPEVYGKVGGHSPALFVGDMWEPLEKLVFPNADARANNDPLALAASRKLNKLSIYLDYGDQDDFKAAIDKLEGILKGAKTKSYELHVAPGGRHDDAYWSSQLENYLLFYGGLDRD